MNKYLFMGLIACSSVVLAQVGPSPAPVAKRCARDLVSMSGVEKVCIGRANNKFYLMTESYLDPDRSFEIVEIKSGPHKYDRIVVIRLESGQLFKLNGMGGYDGLIDAIEGDFPSGMHFDASHFQEL